MTYLAPTGFGISDFEHRTQESGVQYYELLAISGSHKIYVPLFTWLDKGHSYKTLLFWFIFSDLQIVIINLHNTKITDDIS